MRYHNLLYMRLAEFDINLESVISIHGINTDGAWQRELNVVLGPHFNYEPHSYKEYRNSGPLVLILGRRWKAYCIAATLMIALSLLGRSVLIATSAVALVIGVAIAEGARLRRGVVSTFVNALEPYVKSSQRPHVIAHSLGTFIAGTALLEHDRVRFGHIIFFGSVLRRGYQWHALLKRDPSKFTSVRNEVAGKDWVSRAAIFFCGLIPRMGHAGIRGFCGPRSSVHTISDPWHFCGDKCSAPVHNVMHRWLAHCDLSRTIRGQAITFWLPYLWGIEPAEYSEFKRMCAEASQDSIDRARVAAKQDELLRSVWKWCDGSLLALVKDQIIQRRRIDRQADLSFGELQERSAMAIDLAAIILTEAIQAALLPETDGTGQMLRYLMPRFAVLAAVQQVYR